MIFHFPNFYQSNEGKHNKKYETAQFYSFNGKLGNTIKCDRRVQTQFLEIGAGKRMDEITFGSLHDAEWKNITPRPLHWVCSKAIPQVWARAKGETPIVPKNNSTTRWAISSSFWSRNVQTRKQMPKGRANNDADPAIARGKRETERPMPMRTQKRLDENRKLALSGFLD